MSRSFDGNSANYLKLDGSSLGISNSGYTYAFRAKTSTPENSQYYFVNYWNGDHTTVDRIFTHPSFNRFTADHGANIRNADIAVATPLDTWTDYICIVSASDEPRIIALGGDVTAAAADGFPAIVSPELWIGRNHEVFAPLTGEIKDLIVWDKELSAGEITAYQSGDTDTAIANQTRKWLFDTASLTDSIASEVLIENGTVPFIAENVLSITGPDTTTEGSATVQTGTLQDTITTQSLISGTYSIAQTIDSATATTLNYVAESGVNLCSTGNPVSGVPLEPTVTAAGITPYVVQQKADDGINPPATRNITLNGEATHEVIQTTLVGANTTVGESIFGTGLIVVENDMQAYVPKTANGMNITWAADGTFTTDADQTEVITVSYFSPSTEEWSCLALTIKNSAIISATGISNRDDWVRSVLGKDGNTNDLWIEYWISQGATSGSFNDMAYSWLGSLGYTQSLVDRWFSWEEAELGR